MLTNRILQCLFVIGLFKDITTSDDKDDGGREEKRNVRKKRLSSLVTEWLGIEYFVSLCHWMKMIVIFLAFRSMAILSSSSFLTSIVMVTVVVASIVTFGTRRRSL